MTAHRSTRLASASAIDVVINRTLLYGVLTGLLAGAYLGSVLLLQLISSPSSDQRYFHRRYDAQRTIEEFTSRLRTQVSLEAVGAALHAAATDTVQPRHISIWSRGPSVG